MVSDEAAPPLPRHSLFDLEIDLERLVQRARVLRAEELVPGLADAGDGVPHPVRVVGRNEDRHEHVVRDVVEGERLRRRRGRR